MANKGRNSNRASGRPASGRRTQSGQASQSSQATQPGRVDQAKSSERSQSEVSTTQTREVPTAYWQRRPVGALPWVVGGLGLLGLGWAYDVPVRHSIESRLDASTQAKLDQMGISSAQVEFTGRDGVLTGSLPPGTNQQDVISQLEQVNGVRVITAQLNAPSVTPSEVPTVVPSPSEPASSPTATASTEAKLPTIEAAAVADKVTLTGRVHDQAAIDALVTQASKTFGKGQVTNKLTVDSSVSNTAVEQFTALLSTLGTKSSVTANLADGKLSVTGTVPDDKSKAAIEDAAKAVGATGASVETKIKVDAPGSDSDKQKVQDELNDLPKITFVANGTDYTPQGLASVQQAAAILKANPNIKIRVEGHTDDIGPAEANKRLSQARADVVRQTLTADGIAADRLSSIGFGEAYPQVKNDSDAARAKNRRVLLVVQ